MHEADDSPITLELADAAATAALAARLAQVVQPGLTIWLQGDLGAGKTTLVRELLHALGHRGRVKSPSYTLLEQYQAAGLNLRHFDLYRFRDADEWETAGFRDEFNGRNICLIEWPEKAQSLLPQEDLSIAFEILPDGRSITLNALTTTVRQCLGKLQN